MSTDDPTGRYRTSNIRSVTQWGTVAALSVAVIAAGTVTVGRLSTRKPTATLATVEDSSSRRSPTMPATGLPTPSATHAKPQNPTPAVKGGSGRTAGTVARSPYYASCADAAAAGVAPLHRGDPGYRSGLDRDGDGVACETHPSSSAVVPPPVDTSPTRAATDTPTATLQPSTPPASQPPMPSPTPMPVRTLPPTTTLPKVHTLSLTNIGMGGNCRYFVDVTWDGESLDVPGVTLYGQASDGTWTVYQSSYWYAGPGRLVTGYCGRDLVAFRATKDGVTSNAVKAVVS